MSYKIKIHPAIEPLSIEEVKVHLRVDNSEEDEYIKSLITTSRLWTEEYTGLQMIKATWQMYLDSFSCDIEINKTPLVTVDAITYYDSANVLQTLTSTYYEVDNVSQPARLHLNVVPLIYPRLNAVCIEFKAGYETRKDIPAPIKSAMLLIIGHLYEHREDVIVGVSVSEMPNSSKWLLNPYRIYNF